MLEFILASPAVWGLLGALMYALPKLLAGAYSAAARGGSWVICALEFLAALFGGVAAAVVFTPWGIEYLARSFEREAAPHDLRGIAFLLGMVANRAAPLLVEWIGERIAGRRGKA